MAGPLVWLVACGPVIDLDHQGETEGSSGGSTGTSGFTSGPGTTSTSGMSGTFGTSVGSSTVTDTTAGADTGPRFDVWGGDGGGPPGPHDQPMYAPCWGDEQCSPLLECVTIAFGKDIVYAICTGPCADPQLDCDAPPSGWSATCALSLVDGESQVCAVACDPDDLCPDNTWCHELLLPDGSSQRICV